MAALASSISYFKANDLEKNAMNRILLFCCLLFVWSSNLTGQNISVSETEFSQTLTVPDIGNENFTISNSGTSDLTYTITGQAESFASPLNILLFNYNPTNDFSTQLTTDNLLSILSEELPSAIITETDTEDPSVLASLLGGKGVFLVPRVRGACLLYTSPSPRDGLLSRMPSSA